MLLKIATSSGGPSSSLLRVKRCLTKPSTLVTNPVRDLLTRQQTFRLTAVPASVSGHLKASQMLHSGIISPLAGLGQPQQTSSPFSTMNVRKLNSRKLRGFVRPHINLKPIMRVSHTDQYIRRHIGNDDKEMQDILDYLKLDSFDQLIDETVPATIRLKDDQVFQHRGKTIVGLDSEAGVIKKMDTLAGLNKVFKSYQGQGYYPSIIPQVIKRNVLENPKWYTPYTPYQAEISQGRLEMLLNYQTMITELTALDVSNASLLDEATAAAEAIAMAFSTHNHKRTKVFVSNSIFPQTIDVMKTRASALDIELVFGEIAEFPWADADQYCGAIMQTPDNIGNMRDYTELFTRMRLHKVRSIVIQDILSLPISKPAGEMNADIACGSVQRFGIPMGFGGPHPAYIACRDEFKRKMPGRIIGVSKDKHGDIAFRMAMQTREQHIRRDKATSNICTAQALLANMAALFGIWHKPSGLKAIATRVRFRAEILFRELSKMGIVMLSDPDNFFDTIAIDVTASDLSSADAVLAEFHKYGINLRKIEENIVGISCNEYTTIRDLAELIEIFAILKEVAPEDPDEPFLDSTFCDAENYRGMPESLARQNPDFMQQQVFNTLTSETEFMRYIHKLGDKDLGLTHGMIPLGSCTMKLNSAITMAPITFRGFCHIHPFAPRDQIQGYHKMITELEDMLIAITHYDTISLQPNSGANGEFAGLMSIKKYHESRGEGHRNICLIPTSAHGTNPATAIMCGMKVVPIACDVDGNIDVEVVKEMCEKYKGKISAAMITYPSTHGVFEERVKELCDLIHEEGGQIYLDGANLNAVLGLTSPGIIGADVGHLNLHKTFAIPHGGGGPGVGCIGAKQHLKPFIPGHCVAPVAGRKDGAVAAAPYGNGGILPISYSFIKLLGKEGLLESAKVAILNANYIAERLKDDYKIVFRGARGRVAHELILDCSGFKKTAGVSEEDIAKRLMDFGFHAPTMSWPVIGGLMIEPTESEDKLEIDRFIDAFKIIRAEIAEIENGEVDIEDNVMKMSPHKLEELVADEWTHSYSRQKAGYPASWITLRGKVWPSVGRIDQAYGDRNLVCTCPPVSDYFDQSDSKF